MLVIVRYSNMYGTSRKLFYNNRSLDVFAQCSLYWSNEVLLETICRLLVLSISVLIVCDTSFHWGRKWRLRENYHRTVNGLNVKESKYRYLVITQNLELLIHASSENNT